MSDPRERERRIHDLKCWPKYFDAIRRGDKTFELRKNDRDYRVGDVLHLREWSPSTEGGTYTSRRTDVEVTYIAGDGPWLTPGHICMGFRKLADTPNTESEDT